MATNEQSLCNALREMWRMLVTYVKNLSQVLNKLLDRIRQLINRIINSIYSVIAGALRDAQDILKALLGLDALDQNSARREFCKLIYGCKPAIDLIFPLIDQDIVNWYTRNDKFVTPDLSDWGIPAMTFNSKYEVFEYFACRLSLSSLFDSFINNITSKIMQYIDKFKKYLTLDWLLKNTMPGRVLARMIKDYEDFFNEYIFPTIQKLEPYLQCTFALCDFGESTSNFFTDYRARYKIGMDNMAKPGENWKVFSNEITQSLTDYANGVLQDFDQINPVRLSGKTSNPEKTSTLPYDKAETQKIENNATTSKSILVKSERSVYSTRRTNSLTTPNSVDGGIGIE